MIACVFQKYLENFTFQLFILLHEFTRKMYIFLKNSLLFNTLYCQIEVFMKILVFVI